MKGKSIAKIIGWVLVGLSAAAGLAFLLGAVVMWLWNWLMTGLFDLPQISYWQSVGIIILCHILFKSHSHPKGSNHKHDNHAGMFRTKVRSMLKKDDAGALPESAGGNG